jgi:hypothetical protein
MRPGRKCKICSDATLAAKVDALLLSGESARAVSALTSVDRFAVARHRKHALPHTVAAPENLSELELSDRRLADLAEQLRSQYAAAVACGDNKVALDVTKTLARIEAERHRRIVQREAAETATTNTPDRTDPAFFDEIMRRYRDPAYRIAVARKKAVKHLRDHMSSHPEFTEEMFEREMARQEKYDFFLNDKFSQPESSHDHGNANVD